MLRKIANVFNQLVRFPKEDRAMFYTILVAQLEAGMPIKSIFEVLHRDITISPEISLAVAAGYQAIREGRLGTEGLRDCNLFPADEVYLLAVAEEKDVLIDVLQHLRERTASDETFFRAAIIANSYYFALAGALMYMLLKVKTFAGSFGSWVSFDNNQAYVLSVFMNDYAWSATLGGGVCLFIVWFCSNHWYHPLRRCVLFFAVDSQLQMGIKFSALSSAFYRAGATHSDVLLAATDIFGASGFMRGALADLRTRYELQGDAYNDALGETVLLPNIAKVLTAMTPGDDRSAFAKAHNAVEKLQASLVKKRHSKAKLMVLFGLLGTISYLLLTMLFGLYSMYDF